MSKQKKSLILITLILIASFFINNQISKKTNHNIYNYASIEAKRVATVLVNYSVKNIINKNKIDENILMLTKNKEGEIQIIDFNTKIVNTLLEDISLEVQKNILKLENGKGTFLDIGDSLQGKNFNHIRNGIVCELKGGGLFGESLFANTGPVIPIRLSFIGEVLTSIKTSIESYGINNVYLEVDVEVKVIERITMPLTVKDVTIKKNIPIAMKVIQGKVPNYYNDSIEKFSESYSLPLS